MSCEETDIKMFFPTLYFNQIYIGETNEIYIIDFAYYVFWNPKFSFSDSSTGKNPVHTSVLLKMQL